MILKGLVAGLHKDFLLHFTGYLLRPQVSLEKYP